MAAPLRAYNREEQEDCYLFTPAFPKQLKQERMNMVMENLPNEILDLNRPWTAEEYRQADFVDLGLKEARMVYKSKGKEVTWLRAKYVSPQENSTSGHFEDMLYIQKHYLCKQYKEAMLAVQNNPKEHIKTRGTGYDTAWSVEPNHKFNLSKIAQYHASNKEVLKRQAKVAGAILREHVPHLKEKMFFRQWVVGAAATFGHHDQNWLTSAQVNVSDIGENLKSALKAKGHVHIDYNDVPTLYTVMFFLSHAEKDFYHGKFIDYAIRTACEAAPYGALILSSKDPHSGRGYGFYDPKLSHHMRYTYPTDLKLPTIPDEIPFGRVTLPNYPRNDCWSAVKNKPNPALLTDAALAVFGTMRNMYEYRLRYNMAKRDEADVRTPEEWCEAYSWIENGIKETPRLNIAEEGLKDDKELDQMYQDFTHMTLDVGCGRYMPETPGQPKKKKKGGRQVQGKGVKAACRGFKKNKKACQKSFLSTRRANVYCAYHQHQVPEDIHEAGDSVVEGMEGVEAPTNSAMEDGGME
ncbi:hypothetical protein EG329_002977 [Mollisiaceae sp. DMI_Dod_QoI]|nr:hypothetical protein EG329_002977 [Helotiales sp. DMI_Dod_QoI]